MVGEGYYPLQIIPKGNTSDVDPHWSYADPDPPNFMNAYPDPNPVPVRIKDNQNHQIDFKPSFMSQKKNIFIYVHKPYIFRFRLEKYNFLQKKH